MSRIVIFGNGGMGNEVFAWVRQSREHATREIVFASDDGGEGVLKPADIRPSDDVLIAVGDSALRKSISERIVGNPLTFKAEGFVEGHDVTIGPGSVFCPHSMVTCRATIGKQFQANFYSYVAHDCVIGDFVTFAPRVNCNGNVTIGDDVYVGTGACLKQGITIGDGAVIGMGAVVTKDVEPGTVVVGNPARPR